MIQALLLLLITHSPSPMLKDVPHWVVYQRTSVAFPGSEGAVRLRLGDITGGQVWCTVTAADHERLASQSLREGEHLHFEYAGNRWQLELVDLRNVVLGNDSAVFSLRRESRRQDRPDSLARHPSPSFKSAPLTALATRFKGR